MTTHVARIDGHGNRARRTRRMTTSFKLGGNVRWNSEAGYVTGTIIAIHTADVDYNGHRHRASPDDPQYHIKSDRTDPVAAHRGRMLERIAGKDRA